MLNEDDRALDAIASKRLGNVGDLEATGKKFRVHNPNYGSNQDRGTLRKEILRNFKYENPSAPEMTLHR